MLHVDAMKRNNSARVVTLLLAGVASSASAQIGEYDFTFNSATSGLSGNLTSGLATTGTLIGNYTELDNPTGTRTKPGLFGSFGATENVAVPVSLGGGLNGDFDSSPSGLFRMDVNTASGQLSLMNYEANFLAGGPLEVPITLSLEYDTFRTRNPSSTYIGGFPLTLPIGAATVGAFSVRQVGPSVGTVVPNAGGGFDFVVAPLVELTFAFSVLGNEFALPLGTVPFPLAGQLTFDGELASIDSITPIDIAQTFDLNQTLPQFAFDLPTILPPGGTAALLFDLTLNSIGADLSGQLENHAAGHLIPSPAAAPLLLALAPALRRRRHWGANQ